MNFTWIDGKMTREQYDHEHPLAYEEWKKEHGGDEPREERE